jgi:hypothetical protein
MSDFLDTPVLFLAFNRPDKAARVFGMIRRARPKRLFVVADGPRVGHPDDADGCRQVRALIENGIDWDCELVPLFRPENLGCRRSVSQGITWFFEQVEEGIILEDDTLPSDSFFPFCRTLLHRYRDDERFMHVAGGNYDFGRRRGLDSCYVSKHGYLWGWATWRRAWRHYDGDLVTLDEKWPAVTEWLGSNEQQKYWKEMFDLTRQGAIDTWDYQWIYTLFAQRGCSLVPNANLVANIGFGTGATHTTNTDSPLGNMAREEMELTNFPREFRVQHTADDFFFRHMVRNEPVPQLTIGERLHNFRWSLRNPKPRRVET